MEALSAQGLPCAEATARERIASKVEAASTDVAIHTDRLFAALLALQWVAGIAAAIFLSPLAWVGSRSTVHLHVWAATFLGGAIAWLPIMLALRDPGRPINRHVIAIAQMLAGALLIHLTGGRIESHFHVFGSLAFLAFYRDWRVLITASVVVTIDHLVRSVFWPQSVFGVVAAAPWRAIEHAGWVVFEDFFLIASCRRGMRELEEIAARQVELEDGRAFVEARVRERTAQLEASRASLETANHDLASARDAAEAASRAKSAFLATMSHEIRTPLNGVIGMSQLLRETRLSLRQRKLVDVVQSSGEILLSVINDVLDFSKVEAGQMRIEQVDCDLHELVESVTAIFAEGAQRKGLELTCDIRPDVPRCVGTDPARLRQVLANLIGNAVKFTAEGEVGVRVERASIASDVVMLHFEVHDTGIGIPIEAQPQLFAPFVQADASMSRRFGGTGLGLAISRHLIELMGGTIGIESEVGSGSCFRIALPVVLRPDTGAVGPGETLDLRGARVLVVDDNETNRAIVEQQLLGWGARPRSFADGRSALEACLDASRAGDPFALAVLDLHMPEMDGLELARRLRAEPVLASLRLIMLSSVVNVGSESSRASLCDAWLTKPARAADLRRRIAALLGMERSVEAIAIARDAHASGCRPSAHDHRGTVLLVEDNSVNQLVAQSMLGALGWRVHTVDHGAAALEVLDHACYDLVLMDVQMPVMDGFETTRRIRAREAERRQPRTPIVALTANAMSGDRELCLVAGMDDYLAKPLSKDALGRLLAQLIEARRASAGD